MRKLYPLSATEAVKKINAGAITSEDLVRACLNRIETRDPEVKAWQYVDAEAALESAQEKDRQAPIGPLHGIPIGIKDIIDTQTMPTTYGSALYENFLPKRDAHCIQLLRNAGAIILGKTVTAEFATYHPGPTANPLNLAHTPGGSSSGSAAAVADYHVPICLGTQTAGSIIRPASYCGVLGFKPSKARYSDEGVLDTSFSLDTLGMFGRTTEDILLIDSILHPAENGIDSDRADHPPVVGLCRSPIWAEASEAMQHAVYAVSKRVQQAGGSIVEIQLPAVFDRLTEAQQIIHARESWEYLGKIWQDHPDGISSALVSLLTRGSNTSVEIYKAALLVQEECQGCIDTLFDQAEILLTPAAPGIAPLGLKATGDPIFNRMWTALGTPCLGFPVTADDNTHTLPLGVQLVGRPGADRQLLNLASWVIDNTSDWRAPT